MISLLVVLVGSVWVGDPVPAEKPEVAYEALRAKVGRDAGSQIDLALWCEAHGLEAQRVKHLATAVLLDPTSVMARGLLGLVEDQGKWRQPEAIASEVKSDVAHADLMAEYNGHRVRTPIKPDAQYKLGKWCVDKGLIAESRAHFATVLRADPNHAEARKALGFKKSGRRWTTEDQLAAEKSEMEAQKAADKVWDAKLEKLRDGLAGSPSKHAAAVRDLALVDDPRAVPSIVRTFAAREPMQTVAVQLLGQIDSRDASRMLAVLALDSRNAEVRRHASETLRRRDPREWADLAIARIRPKIKYEVKPVGGPGSPGVLFVEGERTNLQRIYRPSDLP